LVVEKPELVNAPLQLEVTLELIDGAAQEPSDAARVLAWPAGQ
jgi:hypothetical protein